MLEDFKIFPDEGISQAKFGMRPSEVKLIMGDFVEEYEAWMDESA